MIVLLIMLASASLSPSVKAYGPETIFEDCSNVQSWGNDQQLAEVLGGPHDQTFQQTCIEMLASMNYFKSVKALINNDKYIDYFKSSDSITLFKQGSNIYLNKLLQLQEKAALAKDYITVPAPIQWAQDLHYLHIEIRYAHRHDSPGCATHLDTLVELTEDNLHLEVICVSITSKIKYVVNLPFWGRIDLNRSQHEYQTVGKYHLLLGKENAPGRWRRLQREDLPKLPNSRLWFEKHDQFVARLYDFEGDDIEDFEGYSLYEEDLIDDEEYQRRKNIPKKGPIPLKKKKKNKGKKKTE